MLDPKTIDLLQQIVEQPEDWRLNRGDTLAALKTPLEVIAWLIETVRNAGGEDDDEAAVVEMLLRDTDCQTLREYAATLGRLGYQAVATRLREMARQRRRPAKPKPPYWQLRLAPRHLQAMN
jgi:hypothetical protein